VACENNERLLRGYFDGELDLVRNLEFEEHLKTCPDCAQELRDQQALRNSLRAANLYERAPESLRNRIRAALPAEARSQPIAMPRRPVLEWLAVAAAILIAVFLGAKVLPNIGGQKQNLVAQEIVASHIRSMQPGHLYDVESTDQHTVKPWFDGKLDFAPPVMDLKDQGFRWWEAASITSIIATSLRLFISGKSTSSTCSSGRKNRALRSYRKCRPSRGITSFTGRTTA